jgi:hypothetical protein
MNAEAYILQSNTMHIRMRKMRYKEIKMFISKE